MSLENVETVRRSAEAFDCDDRTTWLSVHHPDFEVITSGLWPEADVSGPEAAWDFYVQIADAFQERRYSEAELIDAGDKVLVHQRNAVHGRASGAAVRIDFWVVVTFREGLMLRDEWILDRAEALAAAGLSE